ncbi:Sugar ABC transporter permease [Burkholderia multivorans]
MSIRVSTAQLIEARRTLHQALGPALHVYTAIIDNRTGRACLQLELSRARVSQAMSSIMRVLPEAEFGTIRRSAREPVPRTRAARMRETIDH